MLDNPFRQKFEGGLKGKKMTTEKCKHIYCNIKLMRNLIYKLYYSCKDSK